MSGYKLEYKTGKETKEGTFLELGEVMKFIDESKVISFKITYNWKENCDV